MPEGQSRPPEPRLRCEFEDDGLRCIYDYGHQGVHVAQQPRPEAPYRTGLDAPVCATCGQPTAPGSGAFLHDRCTTLPQPLMTSLERQQAAELAHYRELEDVFSGIDTKYQTACDEIERLKALAVRAREFAVQCAYATAAGLPAQHVAAKHLIGLLDDEEAGHRG